MPLSLPVPYFPPDKKRKQAQSHSDNHILGRMHAKIVAGKADDQQQQEKEVPQPAKKLMPRSILFLPAGRFMEMPAQSAPGNR